MKHRDDEDDEEEGGDWEDPAPADVDDDDGDDDNEGETVPCPDCGRPVYEEADVCPYCGSFILRDARARHPRWVLATVLALLAAMALGLLGWVVWF